MSEIEADLDDLEAEDVASVERADINDGVGDVGFNSEHMNHLIGQERRRRCVIRAGLCACAAVFVVSVYKLVVGVTCPGPADTPWALVDPVSDSATGLRDAASATSASPALLKLPLHIHSFVSGDSSALHATSSAAQGTSTCASEMIYRRQARRVSNAD